MPKMKTHKGTKKRVKVTGTGKFMLRHSGKSHILTKKSKKRKKKPAAKTREPSARQWFAGS